MRKDCDRTEDEEYDFDSVDIDAIRAEVNDYMASHCYNFERSSFGHVFNV